MLPAGLDVFPAFPVLPELLEGVVPPEGGCWVLPEFALAFALAEPSPKSTSALPELLSESFWSPKSSSVLPTPEVFASVSCLLLLDELLPPKLENV